MTEVEYTKSGVPKACPGCGHPFHPAGNCHALEAGRCPCERNMAVHLDIPDQPQQHAAGGMEDSVLTFSCNHVTEDNLCPAFTLYTRAYDDSDLYGSMRFHHGWHARDTEIVRLQAQVVELTEERDQARVNFDAHTEALEGAYTELYEAKRRANTAEARCASLEAGLSELHHQAQRLWDAESGASFFEQPVDVWSDMIDAIEAAAPLVALDQHATTTQEAENG